MREERQTMATTKKQKTVTILDIRNKILDELKKEQDGKFFEMMSEITCFKYTNSKITELIEQGQDLIDLEKLQKSKLFCKDLVALVKKHNMTVTDFDEIYSNNTSYEILQAGGMK